jgi:AraC-like DNA-binding protein/mannose-6-phosphate isomerase-like protein (cupin superfamily)
MITTSHLRGYVTTSPSFFSDVFGSVMQAVDNRSLHCRIPRLQHLYEIRPKMQYHFRPEFFIQLGGSTEFNFPDQRLTLNAGEFCIVPKGMPHFEVVRTGAEPFENVVVSFYRNTIDVHLAHEGPAGRPVADDVHFFTSGMHQDLISHLDRICELSHADQKVYSEAIRGLLLAELALLKTLVESPGSHLPTATDTISLCEWLIQHNLEQVELGLDFLAAELSCSPTYLSKLFHRTTGERMIERIQRLRMQSAIESLRNTRLSVKAIATGCGFADPNYFCRTFRKTYGCSPQQYRLKAASVPQAQDGGGGVDDGDTIRSGDPGSGEVA